MKSADSPVPVFDRLDRAFFAFGWLVVVAGLLISPRPYTSPFGDPVGLPISLSSRPHVRAALVAPHRPAPTTQALWPGTETEQHTVRPASDPHRAVDVTGRRDAPRSLPNRPKSITSRAPGEPGADGVTAARSSGVFVRRNHRASVSLLKTVESAANAHGVPFHTLAGLVEDESSWRPEVRGAHGEIGLLQLKRGVARWCGIKDRRNPSQNANCGARYLAAQFDRFGTWEMAIVAFKAGPATIPDNIPASSWAFAQRALLKAEAYR